MACGSGDFACQIVSLIARHAGETSEILNWLPWLQEHAREVAQVLIALAGLSFGVWKWWWYREKVLHQRLNEYLRVQDERLRNTRSDALAALFRPGSKRSFFEPMFDLGPLRGVLQRRGWESVFRVTRIETSADRQLDRTLTRLERRLETAQGQLISLHRQRASAYLLKGAIASARAARLGHGRKALELDHRALDAFRAASQVPGHVSDIELLEYEARQLLRLGRLAEADLRLSALEGRTLAIEDAKSRDLFLAGIKRQRGLLAQVQAVEAFRTGNQQTPGSQIANGFVKGAEHANNSALKLRGRHGPFAGWEGIEQADLHYLAAFICHNLRATEERAEQLDAAETEYRRVVEQASGGLRTRFRGSSRRLRVTAEAGLERVRLAKAVPVQFDEDWLLPPSKPLQRETSTIGSDSSNDPVTQTAQQDSVEEPKKT